MTRQERILQAKQNNYIFELANLENTEIAVNSNNLKKDLQFNKLGDCILIPEKNEVKLIEKKLIKSKLKYFKDVAISDYSTYFVVKSEVN